MFSVMTYEALGLRDLALAALNGATPELLRGLGREPDLADFLRDPRFKEVVAISNKGNTQ